MAVITNGVLSVTVMALRGEIPLPGDIWKDITRPGVLGKGFIWEGYHGEPRPLITLVGVASETAPGDLMVYMKWLQGQIVAITDDNGYMWTNLFVHRIEHTHCIKIETGAGLLSGCEYLLETQWVIEPVGI
jgi:hypothetical protein